MRRKTFAQEIKDLRGAENLSQGEAAKTWGLSVRTLQKWEIGEMEPSVFVAKCILFYLRWRNHVPPK